MHLDAFENLQIAVFLGLSFYPYFMAKANATENVNSAAVLSDSEFCIINISE